MVRPRYQDKTTVAQDVIISAIAAISARSRALGKKNELLWHIPEDLKHFKKLTTGHIVIMGSKTHESIGRALPNRTNIVISRNPEYKAEGCIVVHSLEESFSSSQELENKTPTGEVFVIGGGQIYTAALPYIDRLYLTLVDDPGEGADTFFPEYESLFTKKISEHSGTDGGISYTRVILER